MDLWDPTATLLIGTRDNAYAGAYRHTVPFFLMLEGGGGSESAWQHRKYCDTFLSAAPSTNAGNSGHMRQIFCFLG